MERARVVLVVLCVVVGLSQGLPHNHFSHGHGAQHKEHAKHAHAKAHAKARLEENGDGQQGMVAQLLASHSMQQRFFESKAVHSMDQALWGDDGPSEHCEHEFQRGPTVVHGPENSSQGEWQLSASLGVSCGANTAVVEGLITVEIKGLSAGVKDLEITRIRSDQLNHAAQAKAMDRLHALATSSLSSHKLSDSLSLFVETEAGAKDWKEKAEATELFDLTDIGEALMQPNKPHLFKGGQIALRSIGNKLAGYVAMPRSRMGCLGAAEKVTVKCGTGTCTRQLKEVVVGDQVLAVADNGELGLSTVYHARCSSDERPLVTVVVGGDGSVAVSLTPMHLVPVVSSFDHSVVQFVRAADLQPGDLVVVVVPGSEPARALAPVSRTVWGSGETCSIKTAAATVIAGGVTVSMSATSHEGSIAAWAPVRALHAMAPGLAAHPLFVKAVGVVSDAVEVVFHALGEQLPVVGGTGVGHVLQAAKSA